VYLRLADGTEVFHLSNTRIVPAAGFPASREIRIDGEAFLRTPAGARPLVVRTRLLLLTVSGGTAVRVIARSSETGEEADVLSGRVAAKKAYSSPQNEVDVLSAGEEVMVNETIDLQEKETTDLAGLKAWSAALIAAARSRDE